MKRKAVPLSTKLASALLQMVQPDETGKFVPVIPYEDSKLMSAGQIISLFHFDHGILHADGGVDEPWNLTPRMIAPHRVKTATVDVPQLAKRRRIQKAQEDSRRRILARETGEEKPRSKWPSRPFQSRGFKR